MASYTSGNDEGLRSLVQKMQKIDIEKIENNEDAKIEALALARAVTAALEGPVNRATDLMYRPYISIGARIAVDLGLFEHIVSASRQITSAELASISGGDEILISRVLRLLAAVDFVGNPDVDQWTANETTRAMASPPIAAGHRFIFDVVINSAIKAPKYLRETNFRAPSEPTDGFVQYANQTKYNVFQFMETAPSWFHDFNLFMGSTMGAREYWHEWYDVPGLFLGGFDPSRGTALLVDIGGGRGHDLVAFDNTFGRSTAGYDGRLVLQDLPRVLENIPETELSGKISKVGYDFFEEQPEKGARGYFLHHILHDWSDKYCLQILKRIHDAMVPRYSKLLIHELILPDTGATEIQARYDLVMMTFNGGMERSRSQWIKLLQEAGFINIVIWEHFDHDGIVEAEVA